MRSQLTKKLLSKILGNRDFAIIDYSKRTKGLFDCVKRYGSKSPLEPYQGHYKKGRIEVTMECGKPPKGKFRLMFLPETLFIIKGR